MQKSPQSSSLPLFGYSTGRRASAQNAAEMGDMLSLLGNSGEDSLCWVLGLQSTLNPCILELTFL